MKKENMKKVSFDMEEEKLDAIKRYCLDHKIKLSDFYRSAIDLKLKEIDNRLNVFFMAENGIYSAIADLNELRFVEDTEDEMIEFFNAKRSGNLELKSGADESKIDPLILDEIKKNGYLHCYIK